MNRVCSTFVKHFIYILSVVIVGNSVLVYENLKLCCNFLINFKRLSSKARLFFFSLSFPLSTSWRTLSLLQSRVSRSREKGERPKDGHNRSAGRSLRLRTGGADAGIDLLSRRFHRFPTDLLSGQATEPGAHQERPGVRQRRRPGVRALRQYTGERRRSDLLLLQAAAATEDNEYDELQSGAERSGAR